MLQWGTKGPAPRARRAPGLWSLAGRDGADGGWRHDDHGRAGGRDLATVVDVVRLTREQELDVVNRTFHREV